MRIAIVTPWLLTFGGAEKVVAELADMYPDADIFAMFSGKRAFPSPISERRMTTSFLDRIPHIWSLYRLLVGLHPLAVESLDLRGYGLVISSDAGLAKGVLLDEDALHICYCHTPVRYIWDLYWTFEGQVPAIFRLIYRAIAQYIRTWDFSAAQRVDVFVANSQYIQKRIQKYYRRDSTVIYPPVETSTAFVAPAEGNYYLSVGRLSHTKRLDIAIEACNRLGRKLLIVGSGREETRLKKLAGPTIEFLGRVDDDDLPGLYSNCRAFLFAAYEDFGIVPVEAQAYGRPVLAYGRGGSLETIIGNEDRADRTGMYFPEQTAESLIECILAFEQIEKTFDSEIIRRHAQKFDTSVFRSKMREFVDTALHQRGMLPTPHGTGLAKADPALFQLS